jgi:intracellular sulfur oxidation DsrE/DsrF family protein
MEAIMLDEFTSSTPRRGFIGRITAAAMGLGVASLVPESAQAATSRAADAKLEAWFAKMNGKHRAVFDAPMPNNGFGAIWPRVYILTTEATYPGEKATPMLILRHEALPLAFQDNLWAKYKLGEMFDVKVGGVPATKNPYASITGLPITGIGVVDLMKTGVLVGACDVAMQVYSSAAAQKMGMKAEDVRAEWVAGLLPGVQLVPSGVFAVSRAQELGAQYVFAG